MLVLKKKYYLIIESIKNINLKNIKKRNKFTIIYRNRHNSEGKEDLLKFRKFHTLLDKKSISKLETFYFFNFNKEEDLWILKHSGEIWGIATLLRFKYNKDLICKDEFILFRTNTM